MVTCRFWECSVYNIRVIWKANLGPSWEWLYARDTMVLSASFRYMLSINSLKEQIKTEFRIKALISLSGSDVQNYFVGGGGWLVDGGFLICFVLSKAESSWAPPLPGLHCSVCMFAATLLRLDEAENGEFTLEGSALIQGRSSCCFVS